MDKKQYLAKLSTQEANTIQAELAKSFEGDEAKVAAFMWEVLRQAPDKLPDTLFSLFLRDALHPEEGAWDMADFKNFLEQFSARYPTYRGWNNGTESYVEMWSDVAVKFVEAALQKDKEAVYDVVSRLPEGPIKDGAIITLIVHDQATTFDVSDDLLKHAASVALDPQFVSYGTRPDLRWLLKLADEDRIFRAVRDYLVEHGSRFAKLDLIIPNIANHCSHQDQLRILESSLHLDEKTINAYLKHFGQDLVPTVEEALEEKEPSSDNNTLVLWWLIKLNDSDRDPSPELFPHLATLANETSKLPSKHIAGLDDTDLDALFLLLETPEYASTWNYSTVEALTHRITTTSGEVVARRINAMKRGARSCREEAKALVLFAKHDPEAFIESYNPKAPRREVMIQALLDSATDNPKVHQFLFDQLGDSTAVRSLLEAKLPKVIPFSALKPLFLEGLVKGKKQKKISTATVLKSYADHDTSLHQEVADIASNALAKSKLGDVNVILSTLTSP